MIELGGARLDSLPVTELHKVRHLVQYDGPLLTHFRGRLGDHYLFYWCDCNDTHNRWMLLRVSETNIVRLANGFIPLGYVIPRGCQDDYVYFVDIDGQCRHSRVMLTPITTIPTEYTPEQGAFLAIRPEDETSYPVLIEGDLSVENLTELPRLYSQVYSVLYTLGVLKPQRLEGHPWRGGFSSMHFYNWIVDQIPGEHRPSVKRIQYASPGFIRFSLHRPTASIVSACVREVSDRRSRLRTSSHALGKYIRDFNLNHIGENDPSWQATHNAILLTYTRELFAAMDLGNESAVMINAAPRPFEAAKVAMSFVSRLRRIASFAEEGLIRLPTE